MIGFLNINKKSGITSSKVVGMVKKLCPKGTKVGHMGTLDPMAEGVLPVAVGRATRLFDLMQDKQKEYVAIFKFGYTTNTLDTTGETTATTSILPTTEQIQKVLPEFLGEIEQLPPMFSAKSVDGVRAYKKARKGEQVELKPCSVHIFLFELMEVLQDNSYKFKIVCGSGTYIRSLCRDLAQKLGSLAVMTKLVRTKTGQFCLEKSQDCDNIDLKKLVFVDEVLNFEKVDLTENELRTLLDGKKLEKDLPDGKYLGYCHKVLQLVFVLKNKVFSDKIWLR